MKLASDERILKVEGHFVTNKYPERSFEFKVMDNFVAMLREAGVLPKQKSEASIRADERKKIADWLRNQWACDGEAEEYAEEFAKIIEKGRGAMDAWDRRKKP